MSPFFSRHPVLQFIEQRLPATATIAIPPEPAEARQVATDGLLRVVFAGVLDEFLAPPSTLADKAGDLIGEVCRARPEHTAEWIAVAADAILRHSLPTAEKDLNTAVAAAISARPTAAGGVVSRTLREIDSRVEAGARRTPGRTEAETARRYAGTIVLTAVHSVRARPDAVVLIHGIAEQALAEAAARQSNYLVVETMAALVKGSAGLDGVRPADLARFAFRKFAHSQQETGIICAGALRGAGSESASVIKDEAALNLSVPLAAYATIVCNAYVAVAAAPQSPPPDVSRLITLPNADYIPAVMIGAITANPPAAAKILHDGLNRDLVLHGRSTTRDILEAAVMACEERAPELAAAAVGRGDLMEGNSPAQIAEGLIRGTPMAGIGAALDALLRAQGDSAAEIKATVAGAVEGAVVAKKGSALSAITQTIAAHTTRGVEMLDQILVSAPDERQSAALLGMLAARREEAGVLLDRALKHGDLAAGQAGPLAAGGAVVIAIQADAAEFFRAAVRRLIEGGKAAPEIADAIVLGAALANPRGAAAVAAAAVATTDLPPERIAASASRGAPAFAEQIGSAVDHAVHVKGGSADLFRFVRQQVSARPERAAGIVTGAMAVAPSLGHVTGHAAALAAPDAVTQIVPRLFAFSTVRHPASPEPVDAPGEFAALTSGVMQGVIDARLDADAESRAISEVVAASIKSVVAIGRGRVAASAPGEAAAIVAVISSAIRATRGHSVAIARAAARTVRALSCREVNAGAIRDAVLGAGPRTESAKIADAIATGFAEADQQVPAAEVKALVDRAHDSVPGLPMTPFRDL